MKVREPISRMEVFSGSLVIFIGVFYSMGVLGPLFQHRKAVPYSFSPDQFKMIFYAVFYLLGGVLFFIRRKAGWIICTASLLNIALIAAFVVFDSLGTPPGIYQLIPFLFTLICMAALAFMFNKNIRAKHGITNQEYLFTLMVYLALLVLTYIL